jgi:2-keto-4-pentenoate hydratase/2-oxohepta-3-ene-1,7-dioic acid hydratase in catechol pathway
MKLVLFDDFRPGVLKEDRVVDVSAAVAPLGISSHKKLMPTIIEHFDELRPRFEELAARESGKPRSEVRLRAPDPSPPKLLACFSNYREGRDKPRGAQDMFLKNRDGVIGDGDTVELPPHKATVFHHEAELGAIIGKRCKDLTEANALDAVFGYTCFVDVSGRGLGTTGQTSRMGKSFDTFGPMGPCIATADEVGDPNDLNVKFWVDGQLRQEYSTEDMEYSVAEVLVYSSAIMTLLPGDFICFGTHHLGLGPLQEGDHPEMEIQNVGKFGFTVHDPYGRSWDKGVDKSENNPGYRGR